VVALAHAAACHQNGEHFGRKHFPRVAIGRSSFDGMVVHTGITSFFLVRKA